MIIYLGSKLIICPFIKDNGRKAGTFIYRNKEHNDGNIVAR